jgi:hypothetical protein
MLLSRALVLGGLVVAAVGACIGPLAALGAPRHPQGAEYNIEVDMGTPKPNDKAEFRFYSDQLNAAEVGTASRLTPGVMSWGFTNTGQYPHNFVIVSAPGGFKFRTPNIPPGATQVFGLNLKPGVYLAISTARNGTDLARGMVKVFTVGRYDTATGKWRD